MQGEVKKQATVLIQAINQYDQQSVPSNYFIDYQNSICKSTVDPSQIQKKLNSFDIKYNPNNKYHNFEYKIEETFLNWQMLKAAVKIGYFQFNIFILNQSSDNPLINSNSTHGEFGQIHFIKFANQKVAVKSLNFRASFKETLNKALKQWSIFRICSALGCAPYYGRYFGFDLVIYNDCIQFAMEEGEQLNKISKISNYKDILLDLKQSLSLMHSLNIVHCDIKPDNIVFSRHHQKFVFIDFGFSSIRRQKCGFKSKTTFKGSPSYCSDGMLAIICSNEQHFIDLYYNDSVGVKLSIVQLHQKFYNTQIVPLNKFEYFEEIEDEQSNEILKIATIIQQITFNPRVNIQSLLLLYSFKCYYIFKDVQHLKGVIKFKDGLLLEQYGHQLLIFIREAFTQLFLPEIFQTYFTVYQNISKYKIVERLYKSSKQCLIHNYSNNTAQKQSLTDYSLRFSQKQKELNHFSQISHCQLIYDHLMNKNDQQVQFQSELFEMVLQCLRFDKRSLSFDKKVKLAAKIRYSKQKPLLYQAPSLQDIKFVLGQIAVYLISEHFTQWKYQNGWKIFCECITLEIDISEHISTFLHSSKINFPSMRDKVIESCQILRLMRFIEMKNVTKSNRFIGNIDSILRNQLVKNEQQIDNLETKNQEEQLMKTLFNYLAKDLYRISLLNYEREKIIIKQLQKSNNKRLQYFFKTKIYEIKLDSYLNNSYHQQSLANLKQLFNDFHKNPTIWETLSFFCYCQIKYGVIIFNQFIRVCLDIKKIIDCQQIYESFGIQRYLLLLNNNPSHKEIIKYLKQLLLFRYAQNNQKINFPPLTKTITFYLMKILFLRQQLQQADYLIMKQVYEKLKQEIQTLIPISPTSYRRQLIIIYIFLQFFFSACIPTVTITLSTIQQLEQKYVLQAQSVNQQVQIGYYFYMYLLVFTAKHHPVEKMYYFLNNLLLLKDYVVKSGEVELIMQFSIAVSLVTQKFNFQDLLNQQIEKNYLQLMKRDQIIIYFSNSLDPCFLLSSMNYFKKSNQLNKLYELLKKLINWLQANPFEVYLKYFIENIQSFNNENYQLFKYQRLKKYQIINEECHYSVLIFILSVEKQTDEFVKISILRQISQQLNKLSNFARQYVSFYYYTLFLNLIAIANRKKQFLISKESKRWVSQRIKIKWMKILGKKLNTKKYLLSCQQIMQILRLKLRNLFN